MEKGCTFSEFINMYFDDELSEKGKDELFKHVMTCRECNEKFNVLNVMKDEFKGMDSIELPEGYEQRLHKKLINSVNESKAAWLDGYQSLISKFMPVAVAAVIIFVTVQGVFIYNFLKPKSTDLAQLSGSKSNSHQGVMANQYSDIQGDTSKNYNGKNSTPKLQASEKATIPTGKLAENLVGKSDSDKVNTLTKSVKESLDASKNEKSNIIKPKNNSNNNLNKNNKDNKDNSKNSDEQALLAINRSIVEPEQSLPDSAKDINAAGAAGECQVQASVSRPLDSGTGFDIITKQIISSVSEKKNCVIKNQNDFRVLWQNIYKNISPAPEVRNIDFSQYMVIGVFQGQKPTGGYSIRISKIVESDSSIEVYVNETVPTEGSIVTQSITAPCELVRVKNSDKQVVFKTE